MRMLEENAGVRVSAKSVIYDGPDNLRVSETRFTNWRMI
jgi:hypothetical protein